MHGCMDGCYAQFEKVASVGDIALYDYIRALCVTWQGIGQGVGLRVELPFTMFGYKKPYSSGGLGIRL